MLADLVTQQLHGETGLVAIDVAAMNQQSGRLVDGNQVLVAVENLQHTDG
jgi:hypothetical protein